MVLCFEIQTLYAGKRYKTWTLYRSSTVYIRISFYQSRIHQYTIRSNENTCPTDLYTYVNPIQDLCNDKSNKSYCRNIDYYPEPLFIEKPGM
jgi:ABC-type ATPase with predicted acetyltransferase domain